MKEWPNGGMNFPKQDIRNPEDFEAMSKLVRPENFKGRVLTSADLDVHREHIQHFADLGFNEIYVHNVGRNQTRVYKGIRPRGYPRNQMVEVARRNEPEPGSVVFSSQASAYLGSARVARLATADEDGRPYVVPVCFAFDGHLIYIALDEKPKSVSPMRLKRVRNIVANPHVSLLVDNYSEDWSKLAYVLVSGEARLIMPGAYGHDEAIRLLRDKYPQYREMRIDEQPTIAIDPTSARMWRGSTTETVAAEVVVPPRTRA